MPKNKGTGQKSCYPSSRLFIIVRNILYTQMVTCDLFNRDTFLLLNKPAISGLVRSTLSLAE